MVSFNWGSRSLAGFQCCSAAILPSSDEQWAGGMLAALLGYNSSAWINASSRSSFCVWTTGRLLGTVLLMYAEMWPDYVLSQLLYNYTFAERFGQQRLTFSGWSQAISNSLFYMALQIHGWVKQIFNNVFCCKVCFTSLVLHHPSVFIRKIKSFIKYLRLE